MKVEAVLQHKKMRNGAFKYLIKWKGWGHEHNVWKTARKSSNFSNGAQFGKACIP